MEFKQVVKKWGAIAVMVSIFFTSFQDFHPNFLARIPRRSALEIFTVQTLSPLRLGYPTKQRLDYTATFFKNASLLKNHSVYYSPVQFLFVFFSVSVPSDFSSFQFNFTWDKLFLDSFNLIAISYITLTILERYIFGRMSSKLSATAKNIGFTLRMCVAASLWIIPLSFLHELSHWLTLHLFFDGATAAVVMQSLTSGATLVDRNGLLRLWAEDSGLTAKFAYGIFRGAGNFSGTFYAWLLLVSARTWVRNRSRRKILYLAVSYSSVRTIMVVVSTLLGLDRMPNQIPDFTVIHRLVGADAIWVMPLLYVGALAGPLWFLRSAFKIIAQEVKEEVGRPYLSVKFLESAA